MLTLQEVLDNNDTNIRKKVAVGSIGQAIVAGAIDNAAKLGVQEVENLRQNLPTIDFGDAFDVVTDPVTLAQTATPNPAYWRGVVGLDGGNTTPSAPTLDSNDGADTLAAAHSLGTSEIVFSTADAAYVAYAGTIQVGNVARPTGYWKFKTKAAAGRNESAVALSPAFTVAGAPTPEQAGTNLISTVNYTDEAVWYKENLLPLTTGQLSWRGTNTAYLLRPTSGNPNNHNIHQELGGQSPAGEHEMVACVQVKYAGIGFLRIFMLRTDGQEIGTCRWDIQTQAIITESRASAQPAVALGDGFFEYKLRYTLDGSAPRGFRVFAFLDKNADGADYSGDGTIGMLIDRIAVIALT